MARGAKDLQIALDDARRANDQLTASPHRELEVLTEREGGVEHAGADKMNFSDASISRIGLERRWKDILHD